jgi:hypothetical protein
MTTLSGSPSPFQPASRALTLIVCMYVGAGSSGYGMRTRFASAGQLRGRGAARGRPRRRGWRQDGAPCGAVGWPPRVLGRGAARGGRMRACTSVGARRKGERACSGVQHVRERRMRGETDRRAVCAAVHLPPRERCTPARRPASACVCTRGEHAHRASAHARAGRPHQRRPVAARTARMSAAPPALRHFCKFAATLRTR